MPITLEKVAADRAEITVRFGEETGKVWYRPSKITPEFQAVLAVQTTVNVMAYGLSEVLAGWEITENGQEYPRDPESLARLGLDLLMTVWSAIWEDYEPGKKGSLIRPVSTMKSGT